MPLKTIMGSLWEVKYGSFWTVLLAQLYNYMVVRSFLKLVLKAR